MGESAPQFDVAPESGESRSFGRYVLYAPIARGGMATIHLARLVGDDGFSRIVAAKRLHPQYTQDPDFIEMFRDEAEIASKVRHPNVVPVLDIVLDGEEVVLVQEYVHGVPLDRLFRASAGRGELIPPRIVAGIVAGVLAGLHSAHEATDVEGRPLGIIHRDVSPQNVMVSTEGIPRLLDFGIAKAQSSAHVTRAGLLMGKIAYMAPEQLRSEALTPVADVYSCGVVMWELLALRRMHTSRSQSQIFTAVLQSGPPALLEALEPAREKMSKERWDLVTQLLPVVAKATAMRPEDRYASAAEMLRALLRVIPAAGALEIADWVKACGSEYLERRRQVLSRIEESWRSVSKVAMAPRGSLSIPTPTSVPLSVPTPTSVPLSSVQRVRTATGVVVAASLSPDPQPVSAMFVPFETPEAPAPIEAPAAPSRLRYVVGALVGVSLGLATLLGMAIGTRRAPVESPAPPPRESVVAVASPPVAPPETAAASAPSLPAPPVKVLRESPPPPARKPDAVASPARATPPAATPPAAAPRTDCDPPFYFEGTKKIFKPSCI
jgi:serine/threonine protein kinase